MRVKPCSPSIAWHRFPGEVVPKVLYLGDWGHAEQVERLDELGIKRCSLLRFGPHPAQHTCTHRTRSASGLAADMPLMCAIQHQDASKV